MHILVDTHQQPQLYLYIEFDDAFDAWVFGRRAVVDPSSPKKSEAGGGGLLCTAVHAWRMATWPRGHGLRSG
jgi:hypothetical protein